MPSDAPPRPSFFTATLLLCIIYCEHAFANQVTVDDRDSGLVWDGTWEAFSGQPEAGDGTLTWTNHTTPTVTFTFTGTSVLVYGAFKPVGTWNIQSLYAIDGGQPFAFVPSRLVQQESFRQKFYDSGPLPLGKHTLTITNLGVQLWLDYFAYDDGGESIVTTSPLAGSRDHAGGATSTATRAPASSLMPITTSSSSGTRDTSGGSIPSPSLQVAASSLLSVASSAVSPTLTPVASSIALTLPQSSPLGPPSSSSNAAATPQESATPRESETPQPNAHVMPRATLVGLTVGVTIAGVALLVILLRRRRQRQHHRRMQPRLKVSQNPLLQPDSRLRARESQHSTTSGVGDGIGYGSYTQWLQARVKRSIEGGGASVAGGLRVSGVDAPLVSVVGSEKSTPPPSYREFEGDVL